MKQKRLSILIAATLMLLVGCNSLGAGKQMKQLEMENNRLLSEFRAERQRRESAERVAQQLEVKLAESEKLLARQVTSGSNSPGRLSSLPLGGVGTSAPADSRSPSGAPVGGADLQWQRRN